MKKNENKSKFHDESIKNRSRYSRNIYEIEAETNKLINENQYKTFHHNLIQNRQNNYLNSKKVTYTINRKPPKINPIINFTKEELLLEYSNEIKYLLISSLYVCIESLLIFFKNLIIMNSYKNYNILLLCIIFSLLSFSFTLLYILLIFENALKDKYNYYYFRFYSIILSILIFIFFILETCNIFIAYKTIIDKNQKCKILNKFNKPCGPSYFTVINILNIFIVIGIILNIKFIILLFIRSLKIILGKDTEVIQKELQLRKLGNKYEDQDKKSKQK